jgi:hypothetical protein
MESLNQINWKERERELEVIFSDRFRRVWLQHTRLGSVCITAFPHGVASGYEIFTAFKINDWSVENLKNIVLSKIEK